MKFNIEQKRIINKHVLRFIKDNNLYNTNEKKKYTLNNVTEKAQLSYIDNVLFLERLLLRHLLPLNKKEITLQIQAKFTKWIETLQEKTTTNMFYDFLNEENITFNNLLKQLKYYLDNYYISETIYKEKLNIIEIYKPHILITLLNYKPYYDYKLIKCKNKNVNELYVNWQSYYEKHVKLKF